MKMRLLALGLTLLATGCSHAARPDPSVPEGATTVKVVNDNLVDMNVFVRAQGGGQQFRLGRVSGGHTEVFTIPAAIVHYQTTLSFEMRPLDGSARSRSDIVTLNPGDQITLMISP